jgi:hypothetical protein
MNYLSDPITIDPELLKAAGITLKELHALQGEARRSGYRAYWFDKNMELTNADLEESEKLHSIAEFHFDTYNAAMWKVIGRTT